jgi:hypothetical protein
MHEKEDINDTHLQMANDMQIDAENIFEKQRFQNRVEQISLIPISNETELLGA